MFRRLIRPYSTIQKKMAEASMKKVAMASAYGKVALRLFCCSPLFFL
jgi:hypothetical protein